MKFAYVLLTVFATGHVGFASVVDDQDESKSSLSKAEIKKATLPETIDPAVQDKIVSYLTHEPAVLEGLVQYLYKEDPGRVVNYAKTITLAPVSDFKRISTFLFENKGAFKALSQDRNGILENYFYHHDLDFGAFQTFLMTLKREQEKGTFDGIGRVIHTTVHNFVDLFGPTIATPLHHMVHGSTTKATVQAQVTQIKAYEKLNEQLLSIPMAGGAIKELAERFQTVLTQKLGLESAEIIAPLSTSLAKLIKGAVKAHFNLDQKPSTDVSPTTPQTTEEYI